MDTRRPPLSWELPVAVLTFAVCVTLPQLPLFGDRQAAAEQNARRLVGWEEALRLDITEPLNHWFAGQGWATTVAGYHYAAVYVLTSIGLVLYLYVRDPPNYRWARRSTMLLNLAAAACFTLFPVAPPRLHPGLSIVDTVQAQHIWGTWGSPVGDAVNQLAAFPSLHVAWVVWVLVMVVQATRSLVLISLAAVDVALTCALVIATGNHYPLDLVAGTLLVAVAVPATRPWPPQRRERFARRLGRLGVALEARAVLVRSGDRQLPSINETGAGPAGAA
jgi:membrane-associated phospholipid phosphatase